MFNLVIVIGMKISMIQIMISI